MPPHQCLLYRQIRNNSKLRIPHVLPPGPDVHLRCRSLQLQSRSHILRITHHSQYRHRLLTQRCPHFLVFRIFGIHRAWLNSHSRGHTHGGGVGYLEPPGSGMERCVTRDEAHRGSALLVAWGEVVPRSCRFGGVRGGVGLPVLLPCALGCQRIAYQAGYVVACHQAFPSSHPAIRRHRLASTSIAVAVFSSPAASDRRW